MKLPLPLKILGLLFIGISMAIIYSIFFSGNSYSICINYQIHTPSGYQTETTKKNIRLANDSLAYAEGYQAFCIAKKVDDEISSIHSRKPVSFDVFKSGNDNLSIKHTMPQNVINTIENELNKQISNIHLNLNEPALLKYKIGNAEHLETPGKSQWKIGVVLQENSNDTLRLEATLRKIEEIYMQNTAVFKVHSKVTVLAIYMFKPSKIFPTDDYSDWQIMLLKERDYDKGKIMYQ